MGEVQSQLSTDWTRGEGKEPSDAITAIRWRRRRGGFIKSWHRSIITNNNGRETNQDRHRGISIIIQISRYIGNNYTQTRSPATRGTRRGIHSIESIGFIESVTNNNTNTVAWVDTCIILAMKTTAWRNWDQSEGNIIILY